MKDVIALFASLGAGLVTLGVLRLLGAPESLAFCMAGAYSATAYFHFADRLRW